LRFANDRELPREDRAVLNQAVILRRPLLPREDVVARKRKDGSGKAADVRTQRERPEPDREREEPETLIPGAEKDDLAEELGEESVEAATSGQTTAEDNLNEEVPEETGGPFVETSSQTVYGYGSDRRSDAPSTRRRK
jgi:hypothetical protein